MKVLVTGGAGFIGSHVVAALLARRDEVTVLDRVPVSPAAGVYGVVGDVRDAAAVEEALDGAEAVVHLAALGGVRESLTRGAEYEAVNVGGTRVLLETLRRRGHGRVVFASSSSVYGPYVGGPCAEDRPLGPPASPYAGSKRAAELVGRAAWADHGLPFTALRFFTVYGPRQRPSMAIARFVRLALQGEPLPLYGDGSTARDYTWVADIVRAVLVAVERPQGYQVINVGRGAPVTLSELVGALGRVLGAAPRVAYLPEQPGDVPITHADIRRARERLGWEPTVDLEEGLRRYVAWVRADSR